MLEKILSKGYFPKELPAAFNTESFGGVIGSKINELPDLFRKGGHVSVSAIHNSSRPGLLRRKLSIPNPINMFRISNTLSSNWQDIEQLVNSSPISLTTPQLTDGSRGINRRHSLSELPEITARIRSQSRYILKTDISRFYPSIYTHSIPWAFHTKAIAKVNKSLDLFGNLIDKAVRDSQGQQTMGIPIGPDTSLIIAESILTCIDKTLAERVALNGLRYIDDIHLGFDSLGDAENALSHIQELLTEYELALNPLKTEIIELPSSFENLGISELRAFSFRDEAGCQKSDILHYFNLAFDFANRYPKEPILKFAVSRLISVDIKESNYRLFEDLILQCATSQPNCLSFVTNQLIKYMRSDQNQDKDRINEILNSTAVIEATSGHGNEVANCLWAILTLGLKASEQTAQKIILLKDPVCAVLLTDLKQKGLIEGAPDWTKYEDYMTKNELKGDMWLFTYEVLKNDWFPSKDIQNPVHQHECFRFLKSNNVSFYNDQLATNVEVTIPSGWSLYPAGFSG